MLCIYTLLISNGLLKTIVKALLTKMRVSWQRIPLDGCLFLILWFTCAELTRVLWSEFALARLRRLQLLVDDRYAFLWQCHRLQLRGRVCRSYIQHTRSGQCLAFKLFEPRHPTIKGLFPYPWPCKFWVPPLLLLFIMLRCCSSFDRFTSFNCRGPAQIQLGRALKCRILLLLRRISLFDRLLSWYCLCGNCQILHCRCNICLASCCLNCTNHWILILCSACLRAIVDGNRQFFVMISRVIATLNLL